MKKLFNISYILPVIMIILWTGCNSKKDPVATKTEEDTRVLVKRAFDSVDMDFVKPIFNIERANIIKGRLEKETDPGQQLNLTLNYAEELLKSGKAEESTALYQKILDFVKENKLPMDSATKRNLLSSVGIAYMRLGETQNCVQNHNHQSCYLPIKGEGVHQLPFGSRNAITIYETMLKEFPKDLETKYLLNLAYQTLGEYPAKVPAAFRIDPSWYTSKIKIQPFKDVAPALGLNRNSHAGGVIMDDFTNDGWQDIIITAWSPRDPIFFYVNNGDGSFSDQTSNYGLTGYTSGLNLNQVDFNNDGWLDIFIMRGAWLLTQGDIPPTLLMNTGKGKFEDVTIKAGISKVGATQTSAWTDIDLDGWIDLVVAHESLPPTYERGIDVYLNQKDGTFSYVSSEYGLTQNSFFKGCVATYANEDKYPDMYFSSLGEGTFLYLNQGGNGQKGFAQAGPSSNIGQPKRCFPSWSFDYDNDGNEDLFTSSFTNDGTPALHWMLSHMGKADPGLLPKLFHSKGNAVYEEVGQKMGLTEVAFTMGCNYGDINTDGYLDFYLATGNPAYQSIVPNKMYLNMEGKKFEDVSYNGGFANIQKGHGVAFGDPDHDGDEDMYVVIGGAFDGDVFYNCFFENPNENKNNWLILKLTGKTANKAAIGARVAISFQEDGKERKVYRVVSSGASFGANSLNLEVGLRKGTAINNVTVQWPCKDCPDQVFTGMEINKAYLLTQDETAPAPLPYSKVAFKENADHSGHGDHMHNTGK
ncbi:MAG TPA: VCBS repeat-containing protein [Saprospiraceae bacterium]|nr:VCBS repeat-containing protein [Saprospiraceae bacterium]